MIKRGFYLFFLPLILILIAVYSLNQFNRQKTTAQFEQITVAEGITIGSLVEVAGHYLAEEGDDHLKQFLEALYKNEMIVYIGLFKDNELDFLLSRFEGYFPVVEGPEEQRIIESPIGKIFDIKSTFRNHNNKESFTLHIGFSFEFLSEFEAAANRNFFAVAGLFAFLMLVITGIVIYFEKQFFKKDLELEREKQEKERFKEISLLTSEISHEIKNPLNSIYLSFNTLESHLNGSEEAVFYRDAIKGEIKRITTIINSYSELSKEIRPDRAGFEMGKFLEEFSLLMKGELERHNAVLNISWENPGSGDNNQNPGQRDFYGDSDLLRQVLLNLVKNALEAEATMMTLRVQLDEKKLLTLNLEDNGKGIDEETAGTIFKPYISTKIKGTGLGLHIVLKILDALEGNINLISSVPGKTVFQVTVPGVETTPLHVIRRD